MKLVAAEGSHGKMGYDLGCRMEEDIKHNVALRDRHARDLGMEARELAPFIGQYADLCGSSSLELMEGMGRGSGIPFEAILRFNYLQELLSPEECTTFAALGKATSDGKALLLKNRDKGGFYEFSGPEHFRHREINVVVALKGEDGHRVVGVTAAGSAGIMMGLNSSGVAAAINAGQSNEEMPLSRREMYSISGRPQILREGLECATAREALNHTLERLTASPMGKPGIVWFVDAGNIYVVEGGSINRQFAVQHVTDGAVFRSNHFVMLDHLNNEKALSSICRKVRAAELVEENFGRIDRKKLMEFSADHKNGPYGNCICSHNTNPEASVTVSASIMEIDGEHPEKSRINIALGSPCWAWNHEDGSMTFQMDEDRASISPGFLDGSVYKEFIKAEPFLK